MNEAMLQMLSDLGDKVIEFIDENDITCEETVYQSDRVIENAYEFIAALCEIVGYKEI